MEVFDQIGAENWALLILSSATLFTVLWFLDSRTHKELVKVDITDKELQVHRNILVSSLIMEFSLVLMFWYPLLSLPLFIASAITRFSQEFIDELQFHSKRCSPYESYLHVGMWISVYVKAASMFIWGFLAQYAGLSDLGVGYYIYGICIFLFMSYISFSEWRR